MHTEGDNSYMSNSWRIPVSLAAATAVAITGLSIVSDNTPADAAVGVVIGSTTPTSSPKESPTPTSTTATSPTTPAKANGSSSNNGSSDGFLTLIGISKDDPAYEIKVVTWVASLITAISGFIAQKWPTIKAILIKQEIIAGPAPAA